jgi:hypothetical protein
LVRLYLVAINASGRVLITTEGLTINEELSLFTFLCVLRYQLGREVFKRHCAHSLCFIIPKCRNARSVTLRFSGEQDCASEHYDDQDVQPESIPQAAIVQTLKTAALRDFVKNTVTNTIEPALSPCAKYQSLNRAESSAHDAGIAGPNRLMERVSLQISPYASPRLL